LSTGGKTVVVEKTTADAGEDQAHVLPLSGTSAAQVAEGLNRLKVTPRDMITIFQALREAGVMDADLEIM
jgi:flagellar P-ring protein precursor FlgI